MTGHGLVATPSRGGKAVTAILSATHHLGLQTERGQKDKHEAGHTVPSRPQAPARSSCCSHLCTSLWSMSAAEPQKRTDH